VDGLEGNEQESLGVLEHVQNLVGVDAVSVGLAFVAGATLTETLLGAKEVGLHRLAAVDRLGFEV
jgi:hypothetical protein